MHPVEWINGNSLEKINFVATIVVGGRKVVGLHRRNKRWFERDLEVGLIGLGGRWEVRAKEA